MTGAEAELAVLRFQLAEGVPNVGTIGVETIDATGRLVCSYYIDGVPAVGRKMVFVDPESGVCGWSDLRVVNYIASPR